MVGSRILATPSFPVPVSYPIIYVNFLVITFSTPLLARYVDTPYRARGGDSCGFDALTVIFLVLLVTTAWLVYPALAFIFPFRSFV